MGGGGGGGGGGGRLIFSNANVALKWKILVPFRQNLCRYYNFCQFLPKKEKDKLFTIIYADILIFANVA